MASEVQRRTPARFHEGEAVTVFSQSAQAWVEGRVVEHSADELVRVEYMLGSDHCGKTLHECSQHIRSLDKSSTEAVVVASDHMSPTRTARTEAATLEGVPQLSNIGDRKLPAVCDLEPEKYYLEMDIILELLDDKDVVLLDGWWLTNQSKAVMKDVRRKTIKEQLSEEQTSSLSTSDWSELADMIDDFVEGKYKPLPARQDVPRDAIAKVDLIRRFAEKPSNVPIVAISHCWLDQHHPDPESLLLDQIANVLWAYGAQQQWKKSHTQSGWTGAFFFAWCSMFQPYHKLMEDGRYRKQDSLQVSRDVQTKFQKSLENMHIWYTHARVEKWLFTQYFDCQGKPYDSRGWPTWERTVAHLLSIPGQVLHLSSIDENASFAGLVWSDVMPPLRKECPHVRRPPVLPDKFDEMIGTKHFTSGYKDCERVKSNYRRDFASVTRCVFELKLPCTDWTPEEVQTCCHFVEFCTRLQSLDLGGNALGSLGSAHLAQSVHACSQLKELDLDENAIDAHGCRALARALMSACGHLERINLADNQAGDDGACALAELFALCVKLQDVDMRKNGIGDHGAVAMFLAIQSCSGLERLSLEDNCVRGEGKCFTALSHSSLRSLDLGTNSIFEDAARHLVQTLMHCTSIVYLRLSGNGLSDEAIEELTLALQSHKSLHRHRLGSRTVHLRRDRETQPSDPCVQKDLLEELLEGMFPRDDALDQIEDIAALCLDGPRNRKDMLISWI